MGFLQLFGGALQLTPHLHLLLPEGQWSEEGEWVVLPPPEDGRSAEEEEEADALSPTLSPSGRGSQFCDL